MKLEHLWEDGTIPAPGQKVKLKSALTVSQKQSFHLTKITLPPDAEIKQITDFFWPSFPNSPAVQIESSGLWMPLVFLERIDDET